MEKRIHRLWHTAREYVTHWSVAGVILAATGTAPEHWLADLLHELHLSRVELPTWLGQVDYRLVAVVAGLSIIVGDNLWHKHGRQPPVTAEAAALTPTPETPTGPALPDKPSIAVLAFDNLSGDQEQEYFSDEIAEDIITALSHIRWLFVVARNSSFTFKHRSIDIKQVGCELGVRYVLEGSVRRSPDRLRITAQLIDATTGAQVWAERYDRGIANIFTIQDEIAAAVVTAIEPTMADAERRRASRKALENLDIWELYHRGLWHLFKFTPDGNRLALEFLLKAAALDTDNAAVHTALAWSY